MKLEDIITSDWRNDLVPGGKARNGEQFFWDLESACHEYMETENPRYWPDVAQRGSLILKALIDDALQINVEEYSLLDRVFDSACSAVAAQVFESVFDEIECKFGEATRNELENMVESKALGLRA